MWCDVCDLPVTDVTKCPSCGSRLRRVGSQSGDMRPAFPYDIDLINRTVRSVYGCDDLLDSKRDITILRRVPSADRRDEVVSHGFILAYIEHCFDGSWTAELTQDGASRVSGSIGMRYVVCKTNAVRYMQTGKNLMAKSVYRCDPCITEGDPVIVTTHDGTVVATGTARMSGNDMISSDSGVAVKVRDSHIPVDHRDRVHTWDDVVSVNRSSITSRRDRAVGMIRRTVSNSSVPVTVAFSGGKGGLAVLLLSKEAGADIPVIHIDTGLEPSGSSEYIHFITESLGFRLIEEKADMEVFFNSLLRFGPPSVDNRWCCRTNMAGTAARLSERLFSDGSVSITGTRSHREDFGRTIGLDQKALDQVFVHPISDWDSLCVWLYIFMCHAPFNPLYARGVDNIGCAMCPANDLVELDMLRGSTDDLLRWEEYLGDYAETYSLGKEWSEMALWRWRSMPAYIRRELTDTSSIATPGRRDHELSVTEDDGDSAKARIIGDFDIDRLGMFMGVLGKVTVSDGKVSAGGVTVCSDGSVSAIRTGNGDAMDGIRSMFRLLSMEEGCVGCGICLHKCPVDAIHLEEGRISMDPSACIGCGRCLDRCPSVQDYVHPKGSF